MAAEVAGRLRGQGVDVRLGSRTLGVLPDGSGDVVITVADGSEVRAEQLLCATGRTPVTADLGLDAAGVKLTDCG